MHHEAVHHATHLTYHFWIGIIVLAAIIFAVMFKFDEFFSGEEHEHE